MKKLLLMLVMAIIASGAHAAVMFYESFESPVVAGYSQGTSPDNGNWVRSNVGFGSGSHGIINNDAAVYPTPYGNQSYAFRYTNSGLTTAEGVIGNIEAGVTYTISFAAGADQDLTKLPYRFQIVTFGAEENRQDVDGGPAGTVIASVSGDAPEDGSWGTVTLEFTVDPEVPGQVAAVGKDMALRFLGGSTTANIDYVKVVVGGDQKPSPVDGATVPAGDVVLNWNNTDPNNGNPVYIDVWYGTNPDALSLIVDGVEDANTVTVNAPVADTYYWRVDTHTDGNPDGTPLEDMVYKFYVIDTDGDGLPDEYELLYTTPPSGTSLDPNTDIDGDGLITWDEYTTTNTKPNNPDTDGDTLLDGAELIGVDLRPATDPLKADTDNDGLSDGVETNTGVFVDAADTGTNPIDLDWDKDGLKDGVETNTGTFVSAADTGTDPYSDNTDNDNATDWYEVAASFTDPTDAGEFSPIPYPLPDPDPCDIPADFTTKPVKVYIMSGQSNMVGFGKINGNGPGYLSYMANVENKFPNLVDDTGAWTERNDVYYRGVISDTSGSGPLNPGAHSDGTIGPEMGFGQVMGYFYDEPVLMIKASIGNRSLIWDYAPPGSPQFVYGTKTYAGYGDSPASWDTGTTPTPVGWYSGYEWDRMFLNESDMGPTLTWTNATDYPKGVQIRHNGVVYNCINADFDTDGDGKNDTHTSSPDTEPGIGAQSSVYWSVHSVFNVVDILDNFAAEYPQFADQGFEIAGYVWWQGHKDQEQPQAGVYESYMTNFINEIRDYYEGRYPDNTVPNAPFVLATIGFDGWNLAGDGLAVADAQLAVGDPDKHPEFAGNVKTVESRGYWRDSSVSPTGTGYHYNHNAETYMLTGDALGRAMIELDATFSVDAGDDMVTWSGEQVQLDAAVQADVTVSSYSWSASPADGVVFSATDVEDPTVTITKATENPSTVVVTLTVDDGENPPVSSSVSINVYDDACKATIAKGLNAANPTDLNGDCTTNLADFAELAAKWLDGGILASPQHKQE